MTIDDIKEINPEAVVWGSLNDAIIGVAVKKLDGPMILTSKVNGELVDTEIPPNEDGDYDRWGRTEFGPVVVYSVEGILELLMNQFEITDEDVEDGSTIEDTKYEMALEYFEYNIDGAFVGEFTPIHLEIQ